MNKNEQRGHLFRFNIGIGGLILAVVVVAIVVVRFRSVVIEV